MKKTLLLLALTASLATTSMAWTNELTGLQRGRKGIISNGFYVFLGLGVPMGSIRTYGNNYSATIGNYTYKQAYSASSSYVGANISIEIGNQFMFYKTDKLGIGMNFSWLTVGFNSLSGNNIDPFYEQGVKCSFTQLEFNLLRLGPMASFALSDDVAVDAFLNISPTAYLGFNNNGNQAYATVGLLFVPGARIRYKKLAVGLEVQMGSTKGSVAYDRPYLDSYDYTTNTYNYIDYPDDSDIKISVFKPRLTVGFKF